LLYLAQKVKVLKEIDIRKNKQDSDDVSCPALWQFYKPYPEPNDS